MPAQDSLTELEEALRRAVFADQFHQTGPLFDRYAAVLEKELGSSPPPERVRELQVQTSRLLEWVSVMATASRDRAVHELSHLQSLALYGTAGPSGGLDTRA